MPKTTSTAKMPTTTSTAGNITKPQKECLSINYTLKTSICFQSQMESFISGYAYGQGQRCSGRRLGYETSLESAQAKCNTNEECTCIHDMGCDGDYWYMHVDRSTVSSSDCSWSKPGSLF